MQLGVASAWPFFVCLAVLLALAATPLFALADSPPADQPGRLLALDGLRGLLALAVYFHHAPIAYGLLTTGAWHGSTSRFFMVLGQSGVSVFFMITGYLFWSRLVRARGRTDWVRLYIGRLFRIAPLYLAAVACMGLIVAARSGFTLAVPLPVLAVQLARWLSLGLFGGDLNGVRADTVLAGVTWSLRYEWLFYLGLPLAALAARGRHALAFCMAGLVGAAILLLTIHTLLAAYAALFFTGMACASAPTPDLRGMARGRGASILALGLLALVLGLADTAYSVPAILGLGAVFYLVISGCSLFGLLHSRAAHRLGDVSYGIYLLQGLVLTLVVEPLAIATGAVGRPGVYWLTVLAGGVVLVVVAMLAHVAIERPGIAAGRAVAARLGHAGRVSIAGTGARRAGPTAAAAPGAQPTPLGRPRP